VKGGGGRENRRQSGVLGNEMIAPQAPGFLSGLQLWWLGLPDARRSWVSRGSCTCLEQSSTSL